MVRFELPQVANVQSARLLVYVGNVDTNLIASQPLCLHKITSVWDEDTVVWSSSPEYDATVLSSVEYSEIRGNSWLALTVPREVIRGWLASPSANYGFMLKRETDADPVEIGASNMVYFSSSEALDPALRPKLELTYINDPGLTDWQTNNFGSTTDPAADLALDADGDKFTNYQEWIAGSSPTNINDVFQVADSMIQSSTAGFVIRWSCVPSRYYSVYSKADIMSPVWVTNVNRRYSSAGGFMTYTNLAGSGTGYFRIGVDID